VEDRALFKKGGALYKSGATIHDHVKIVDSIPTRMSKQAELPPMKELITQTIMKQKMTIHTGSRGLSSYTREPTPQEFQYMVDVFSRMEVKFQPQWVTFADL